MPLVKIKEKGQVTLPAKIRRGVGLGTGDYVKIEMEGRGLCSLRKRLPPAIRKSTRQLPRGLRMSAPGAPPRSPARRHSTPGLRRRKESGLPNRNANGIHAASGEGLQTPPFKKLQALIDKQMSLLRQNLRHPSIRAKKYDEGNDIWQGRINRDYRFYFYISDDTCYIITIIPHPK